MPSKVCLNIRYGTLFSRVFVLICLLVFAEVKTGVFAVCLAHPFFIKTILNIYLSLINKLFIYLLVSLIWNMLI